MILMGANVSLRLKKRCIILEQVVVFITNAGIDIEYVNLPIYEILYSIQKSEVCNNLDFLDFCINEWETGESFYLLWLNGINKSDLPFKKDEKEKLKSLGQFIGTSDVQGQKNILALYKVYFDDFKDKARAEYEKYAKMSVMVSVVSGIGFFIILM